MYRRHVITYRYVAPAAAERNTSYRRQMYGSGAQGIVIYLPGYVRLSNVAGAGLNTVWSCGHATPRPCSSNGYLITATRDYVPPFTVYAMRVRSGDGLDRIIATSIILRQHCSTSETPVKFYSDLLPSAFYDLAALANHQQQLCPSSLFGQGPTSLTQPPRIHHREDRREQRR